MVYQQHFYNTGNWFLLADLGKLLFNIIFMKSREDLADGKEIYYNIA